MRKQWIARLLLAGVAMAVLGACATVPPSQQEGRVVELIDRLNTYPVAELADQTGMPFLFVDQVLYAEADVLAVLARLREGELVVAPQIVTSVPADGAPEGARFDVGVFYDRLPGDARHVLVESNAGELTLLVGGEGGGLPLLLGIRRGQP